MTPPLPATRDERIAIAAHVILGCCWADCQMEDGFERVLDNPVLVEFRVLTPSMPAAIALNHRAADAIMFGAGFAAISYSPPKQVSGGYAEAGQRRLRVRDPRAGWCAVIREHLLLGNEAFGTLKTACGRTPEKIRDGYVCGAGPALPELEYKRIRGIAVMHPCGRCERAWRKICRDRNQRWTMTARDRRAVRRP